LSIVASIHPLLSAIAPVAYTALRIAAGLLFMAHGLQKIFGLFGGREVELMSRLGIAGLIETTGGALIALGLLTSPVAFVASGEMALAYFLSHYPKGPWPIQNGGELAILYCFLFLYVSTRGGGRFSADSLRR
jgi:putative oxidoreductase